MYMIYVNFSPGEQESFLRNVKKRLGFTWREFSNFLNVSNGMVYLYLREESKISYSNYQKICDKVEITPLDVDVIEIKNKEYEITKPRLNKKFSEFLGIIAGDGYLNPDTYEVSVILDSVLDLNYSDYVIDLYSVLFNIDARKFFEDDADALKCYSYSKQLFELLTEEFNMAYSRRKGKNKIPEKVKRNKEFLISYMRGLFDTDGSFHRHRYEDAMLGIFSRDERFLKEVRKEMKGLGFNFSISGKNMYIYSDDDIDRFFNVIGSSNPKHKRKYLYYKNKGTVPLTKDIRSNLVY